MTVRSNVPPIDRSGPPSAGPIRSFHLPAVTSDVLDNGLSLRLLRSDRLPLVTVLLTLDAGEGAVGGEEAGLAVLTGEALRGGTEERDAQDLARTLEGLGADLGVHTGWDSTTVSVTVLPDRLEEAMRLLTELVRRPAVPPRETRRVRDQRLAAVQQRRMNPALLADDEAVREFYADEAAFGRPLAGLTGTVGGLGPEEVRGFLARCYGPDGGGVSVVGDADPEGVRALAEEGFGDWTPARREGVHLEVSARDRERRIVVVHRPGAVQSELRIGHVGLPRSTPDYFPLRLFNTLLGGSFTSRLNLSLREERGFTYGVRSHFAFRRAAGPFSISTAVGTEQTAPAVAETLSQVEALVRNGPEEEELEAARDYLVGVFPLRFETTVQVAARLAELVVYDLPDDFHATFRDRLGEVRLEEVVEAGRRAVRPEELVIVVVGDADAVAPPLEELGRGPVTVRDAP